MQCIYAILISYYTCSVNSCTIDCSDTLRRLHQDYSRYVAELIYITTLVVIHYVDNTTITLYIAVIHYVDYTRIIVVTS